MPEMNLLSSGTTLALIQRVPSSADELWERAHRREGGIIRASGAAVRRAGEALDRLGLSMVACDGVKRTMAAARPLEVARLRYHVVNLLESAARVVTAARALALELLRDRPEGQGLFDRHRAAIARIERLAADASRPGGPPLSSDARKPGDPAPALEEPVLTLDGVGAPSATRRSWQPLSEIADQIVADAAAIFDDAARAVVAFVDRGGVLELDLRIEAAS